MRVLYALQGTGNGHVARALQILPWLQEEYPNIEILISGYQSDLVLPFDLNYQFHGMSFVFGKNGGVSYAQTLMRSKPVRFIRDISQFKAEQYDLILNDFEPVSAWGAKRKGIPFVNLSHQAAVLHPKAPKPIKEDKIAKWILNHYAPYQESIGFHFEPFAEGILGPVLNSDLFEITPSNEGHIVVYLPSYSDKALIAFTLHFPEYQFQIFSKHSKQNYQYGNVEIIPVNRMKFLRSLSSSEAAIIGSGFEGPSEALYLRKKLISIPMHNQYEQILNAEYLKKLNALVVSDIKGEENISLIKSYLSGSNTQSAIKCTTKQQFKEELRRTLTKF